MSSSPCSAPPRWSPIPAPVKAKRPVLEVCAATYGLIFLATKAGQFEFVLVDVFGFAGAGLCVSSKRGVCRASPAWGGTAGSSLSIGIWAASLHGRDPTSGPVISTAVHPVMMLFIENMDLLCRGSGALERL